MFTGIVEHKGRVTGLVAAASGASLRVDLGPLSKGLKLGDSVAVDGVCLTITDLQGAVGHFDVGPESLQRSTLASLKAGHAVHLERAMRADGRLDGHIVQGHVDAVARIVQRSSRGQAIDLTLQIPGQALPLVVEKGSIAIAGVSLTVNSVDADQFSVSLVPFTQSETYLAQSQVGDHCNIEFDIIGRYIAKLLQSSGSAPLSLDFLKENGFA